jgi:hypothetical protein
MPDDTQQGQITIGPNLGLCTSLTEVVHRHTWAAYKEARRAMLLHWCGRLPVILLPLMCLHSQKQGLLNHIGKQVVKARSRL